MLDTTKSRYRFIPTDSVDFILEKVITEHYTHMMLLHISALVEPIFLKCDTEKERDEWFWEIDEEFCLLRYEEEKIGLN